MSSVAVLTPESFAEHRSGLKDQEITGSTLLFLTSCFPQTLYPHSVPAFEMFASFFTLHLSACLRPSLVCPWLQPVFFS